MKTLADEVLGILQGNPDGISLKDACARLAADRASVRLAFLTLDETGDAKLCRRGTGRGYHLVPLDYPGRICVVCQIEFTRPKRSTRTTCSRACQASLGWRDPDKKSARCASLKAAQRTPKALARTAQHNRKRWSKPGEREKLAEQNRRQWRDPVAAAKRANSICKVHRTPEARKRASDVKKRQWQTPEYREKTVAAIRQSKGTPEARAKFSELLKQRWQDPVMREKYLAATARNRQKATAATRGKSLSTEHRQKIGEAGSRTKQRKRLEREARP